MTEPTFGHLKALLARAKDGDYPSRVNPGMTHTQALGILRAAVNHWPDDRVANSPRDVLIARNVQRECRERQPHD